MTKKIGLIGYGVVARGFFHALSENPQLNASIKKIAIKNPLKARNIPPAYFTTDIDEVLNDPDIDLIVELIDDAEVAYQIAKKCLMAGRPVISANKKMIAENIKEVATWHERCAAPFLYEAAVAGSIPILHNLEQFFKYQEITSLRGILNGSTNYILSTMREEKLTFEDALQLAQQKGFAESDPSLDISGSDAMYKLIILAYHAFGIAITDHGQVRLESITNMEDHFYTLAESRGQKIKSIATAYKKNGSLLLKVQPELVGHDDELFGIEQENNAISVTASLSGKQLYVGKGAGSLPTGSAVINDLSLLLSGFRYEKNGQRHLLEKTA